MRKNIILTPNDFISEPVTTNINNNNKLTVISHPGPVGTRQQTLNLGISRQIEIDGIEMGVLSDGTPFLKGSGLARICGVRYSVIQDIGYEWNDEIQKPTLRYIL